MWDGSTPNDNATAVTATSAKALSSMNDRPLKYSLMCSLVDILAKLLKPKA